MKPTHEVSGIISLKHVYEIAKFVHDEVSYAHLELHHLCLEIIYRARQCGIKVIKEDLNPDEYKEFLNKRKQIETEQVKEIAEKRAAKLMRAAAATTTAVDTTKK